MLCFGDFRVLVFYVLSVAVCVLSSKVFDLFLKKEKSWTNFVWAISLGLLIVVFPLIFSEKLWWADMLVWISIMSAVFLISLSENTAHPIRYELLIGFLFIVVLTTEVYVEKNLYEGNIVALSEESYRTEFVGSYYVEDIVGKYGGISFSIEGTDSSQCEILFEDRMDCEVVKTKKYSVMLNRNYREPIREEILASTTFFIKVPIDINNILSSESPS